VITNLENIFYSKNTADCVCDILTLFCVYLAIYAQYVLKRTQFSHERRLYVCALWVWAYL